MVFCIALILQCCTSDYTENLGGGYFFRNEGGDLKDILSKEPKGGEVPSTVIAFNYDKNFIKGRIVMALNWERLLKMITSLLDYYNIDYQKLNLDLENLLRIRNDVAHYGQFRTKFSKKYLSNLIFYNRIGLCVLLLTELGYDGLIKYKKGTYSTMEKIQEFYKKSPSP